MCGNVRGLQLFHEVTQKFHPVCRCTTNSSQESLQCRTLECVTSTIAELIEESSYTLPDGGTFEFFRLAMSFRVGLDNCMWSFLDHTIDCFQAIIDWIERCRLVRIQDEERLALDGASPLDRSGNGKDVVPFRQPPPMHFDPPVVQNQERLRLDEASPPLPLDKSENGKDVVRCRHPPPMHFAPPLVQNQDHLPLAEASPLDRSDCFQDVVRFRNPAPVHFGPPVVQPVFQPTRSRRFYAVAVGRNPGIYDSWLEAAQQVNGYGGNVHRAFTNRSEAEWFMHNRGVRY